MTWKEILEELMSDLKEKYGGHVNENGELIFDDATLQELYEQGILTDGKTAQDVIDAIDKYIAAFSSSENR